MKRARSIERNHGFSIAFWMQMNRKSLSVCFCFFRTFVWFLPWTIIAHVFICDACFFFFIDQFMSSISWPEWNRFRLCTRPAQAMKNQLHTNTIRSEKKNNKKNRRIKNDKTHNISCILSEGFDLVAFVFFFSLFRCSFIDTFTNWNCVCVLHSRAHHIKKKNIFNWLMYWRQATTATHRYVNRCGHHIIHIV